MTTRALFGTASLLAALALAASARTAAAQELIFADIFVPDLTSGSIQSVPAIPGAFPAPLLDVGGGLRAVEVDRAPGGSGKIYFADVDTFSVKRCNPDGSNVQDVVAAGLAFPSALAIGPADGGGARLYIADQSNEMILSCDLDGSNLAPVIATPVYRGLAVDPVNQKLYWTTSVTPTTGRIMRSNLDGSDPVVVVPITGAVFKPAAIAVDPGQGGTGGKLYWTDSSARVVRRADLDGSNMETIHLPGDETTPRGIDLDLASGHVYWGEEFNFEGSITGFIVRANLDGSDFTPIVLGGIGIAHDLVFLPAGGEPPCPADWNNDNTVNSTDISAYLTAWLDSVQNGNLNADFDNNFTVNSSDISAFLTAWLQAIANGC